MIFEPRESPEILIKIFFVIEPAINVSPRARPTVDHREISPSHKLIHRSVGLCDQVTQFDIRRWRDTGQSIANSSRGAVVTLSKTGGEDQDLFHDSLGEAGKNETDTADGSLMDIYVRQSKLPDGDEISRICLARPAPFGLGNNDRYHRRSGCADGVSAPFRSRARSAFPMASARFVRHRSGEAPPNVPSLAKLHASGSKSAGYSGYGGCQRGGHRVQRPASQCRNYRWNLFRYRFHRHHFSITDANAWRSRRSPLVVKVHHLIPASLLVRHHHSFLF